MISLKFYALSSNTFIQRFKSTLRNLAKNEKLKYPTELIVTHIEDRLLGKFHSQRTY